MRYPELNAPAQEQLVTEDFAGYNHNLRIADGEFYEMQNLTSDYYPLLSQRAARAMVGDFSDIQGPLAKDALAWIEDGVLWYNALSMAPYMGGCCSPRTKTDGVHGRVHLRFPGRMVFQYRGLYGQRLHGP